MLGIQHAVCRSFQVFGAPAGVVTEDRIDNYYKN